MKRWLYGLALFAAFAAAFNVLSRCENCLATLGATPQEEPHSHCEARHAHGEATAHEDSAALGFCVHNTCAHKFSTLPQTTTPSKVSSNTDAAFIKNISLVSAHDFHFAADRPPARHTHPLDGPSHFFNLLC